jgi:hypothetical protein
MPELDAVTDADREWFEARPARRYRLRPTALAELLPGESIGPGSRTVVARCGSPLTRMRLRVGRPPPALRQDTDRVCEALLRLVDARGGRIGGRTVWEFMTALRSVDDEARPRDPLPPAGARP